MDQDLLKRIAGLSQDALFEMKKLLRSRCADRQLSAADALESCLRSESLSHRCPLREFMLEEDMVGFLCDAMTTNSWPLLERLTSVLELLSDSDKMLQEGHAVLAAEALQRRVHFLGLMVGSSTDCESALRAILGLLSTLLLRWKSLNVRRRGGVSGLCTPMGMLSTLRLVLEAGLKDSTSAATTLAAAHTLCGLINLVVVGAEPGDPYSLAASIASCVRAALACLHRLLEESAEEAPRKDDDEDEEQLRSMACECVLSLLTHIIGARVACEETLGREDDALLVLESLEDEVQEAVLEKCLPLVMREATAAIKESLGPEAAAGSEEDVLAGLPALVGVLLDSLQTSLSKGKDPVALSDRLVCENFLWLLPTLHRVDPSYGAPLRLLFGVLAHLAHDLLDAGSWWEGGAEDLASFLDTAKSVLPLNNCEWPNILEMHSYTPPLPSAGPPAAAQLLVLMLAYFRFLADSDCDREEMLALACGLPTYIQSLPARTPVSILKMTWVSYSVSCLMAEEASAESRAAGTRLATLLEQTESVERAYTHHPAVLFWAFHGRSGMPPQLQKTVAELWLRDGDAPSNVAPMLELVAAHPAAVHPLLDVVCDGVPEAAQRAARVLAKAAASSGTVAADLSAGLWVRVPVVLSSSASRPDPAGRQDGGCGLLVWLAAEVFRPPPADMVLRVANLLGGALGRQRLGSEPHYLSAAMFILRRLLEDARCRSDPRVHTTLLSDTRFAQALLLAARYKDARTCTAALDLLRLLEQDNALLKVPVVQSPQTLEMGVVLLAVNSVHLEVFEAGLLLLQEVLKPKEQSFVSLEQNEKFLRSVYFVLQNKAIKFKDLAALGVTVWTVLRELLSQSEMIVHQPWNHVLVSFTLKQGPMDEASIEVLAFLLRWLSLLAPTKPPQPTPRRPLRSMLTETCIEIATALVNADKQFQASVIARDIGKALLRVTANLPTSLHQTVEEIATEQ
ncbi:uncharacterized protein LOC113211576 [Frankliniella occidentalis]|uniref:Uncharacterized protein LOC113211576 n=1 Tax=Frankliniella occidentalis TaxID=133901 RepID=A0A6J1T566_FRAOC|nr:uncharacterized protein LOC113211576 [Frankliniella occidentalis]